MVTKSKDREKKVFYSMAQIRKEYWPKSYEERKSKPKDARQLGISWAKESLDKIKDELNKLHPQII